MEANALTRSTSFIANAKLDTTERYVKLILTSAVRKIATIKRLIYVHRVHVKIMAHVNRVTLGFYVHAHTGLMV
jgi:hypothetical protein